ncbi:MAG: radical SAM family heme chaperone HemW [Eubacteriales bacterium]|nr:radical SAM family heme chaperone HemW [Eubacteriales bacterium]
MNNKQELELYIHIPFCARKCAYCDFLSFAAPERAMGDYVEKLIEEIYGQAVNFQEYRVTTIFVGGGTPSILPAERMGEIFAAVFQCFDVAEDAEITVEANPGTLTMEKLEVYRESGVNRLSLGLQSADDRELKYLGRIHTYDDFLKSYQRARQAGFANINVDLMSALPGQDVHSWKTTLRKVMMLRPEHISAYSLIIEEGTPFYSRYGEGRRTGAQPELRTGPGLLGSPMSLNSLPELPGEDVDREMYHLTKTLLAEHGYDRYEISNYARPGFACRHNIGYWTGVEYLGLGLGASSYVFRHRYRNTDDFMEYLSLDLRQAGAAARDIQELTVNERMEEFMFLGLRMMRGVSGSDFLARFGQNMWNVYGDVIEKLRRQGLLEVESPMIRLTELGIDVSNTVLSGFLLDS